ncbi:haloacid dehalogenase type II [Pseudonocardia sp. ICBG162]|uniref:haloacid dehalogenase type II n=1 Tax=Pseudonocardia sp. ICBG162 TaxID=2846761 RepID=UPI001CF694E8|nr:haloacid dehalogenase type II [Pseudonocardia sp. ICBG162]
MRPEPDGDQATDDVRAGRVGARVPPLEGEIQVRAAQIGPRADEEVRGVWRDRYLPSMAQVNNGDRDWAYLDTLHRESLDELLATHDVGDELGDAAREELVAAWHHLPPWPDSAETIERLRTRFRVVALSNGGFALLVALVKAAGLRFDAILSAELARAYKPAPGPYRTAAELMDVSPHQVLMVAAHGWDIDGARAAGLRTAFLARPGEKGPHRPTRRARP